MHFFQLNSGPVQAIREVLLQVACKRKDNNRGYDTSKTYMNMQITKYTFVKQSSSLYSRSCSKFATICVGIVSFHAAQKELGWQENLSWCILTWRHTWVNSK